MYFNLRASSRKSGTVFDGRGIALTRVSYFEKRTWHVLQPQVELAADGVACSRCSIVCFVVLLLGEPGIPMG